MKDATNNKTNIVGRDVPKGPKVNTDIPVNKEYQSRRSTNIEGIPI